MSLAAIGYHFGSKDALMNQAVYESIGDWGEEVQRALTAEGASGGEPLQRFESIMGQTIESFSGPGRGLWAAQLELISLLEHNEELRTFLAGVQREAAMGLAELFLGIDPADDPEPARLAGWSCTPCSSASCSSGSWTPSRQPRPANSPRDCGSSPSTWWARTARHLNPRS